MSAFCGVLVVGCDHESAPATVITVTSEGGDVPAFVAVVAGGKDIVTVSCPDGAHHAVHCTPTGLDVDLAPPFTLTVKSRGFEHRTVSVDEVSVKLDLEPLPEPSVTEDYSTGFGADEFERFLGLAVAQTTELGPTHSVKFYVRSLSGSPKVYFQNTEKHPLHYGFVTEVLHENSSLDDFELATYHGASRDAAAGTLVYYPTVDAVTSRSRTELKAPITLNFFPSDYLSPKLVVEVHRLIEERLGFAALRGRHHRLVYLPAGERQVTQADAEQSRFLERDVPRLTQAELFANVRFQSLNPGVAFGRLRLMEAAGDADETVAFTDILLLPNLPNRLPVVAGTITEAVQTPLSHVNVAARTRGTPNMSLRDARQSDAIAPYLDKLVRYEVRPDGFSLAATTEEEVRAFYEQRKPARSVPVFELTRTGLPSFQELGFGDSLSVGAKAANLAELRRLLGELAVDGFAVPMSAYDAYMKRNIVDSANCSRAKSACFDAKRVSEDCEDAERRCDMAAAASLDLQQYAEGIAADDALSYDTKRLAATLHGLRELVIAGAQDSDFAAALDERISQVFGPGKVRLRSSTNAEDLPGFSGAGLYDSVSAWATGADRASERIKTVWASVWGFRAFQERRYWNVDHASVRMGVAVNAAHDDEVANGVLVTQNLANPNLVGMYVNVQIGELEVTNPTPGHAPEVFTIVAAPGGGIQSSTIARSSTSPDRLYSFSEREVEQLYRAASRVQTHFAELYESSPEILALDIEFKFCGPSRTLVLKQVRPYVTGVLQ
ncbi:MAG: PEP/pyruvate-binding domain-containing protein [Polyangiaceae bacterium]